MILIVVSVACIVAPGLPAAGIVRFRDVLAQRRGLVYQPRMGVKTAY